AGRGPPHSRGSVSRLGCPSLAPATTPSSGPLQPAAPPPTAPSLPALVWAQWACRPFPPPREPPPPPVGAGPVSVGSSAALSSSYERWAFSRRVPNSSSAEAFCSMRRTPPEASSRPTRLLARGQLSQKRVGNGVPSSRIGGTLTTTGTPR